MDIQVPLLNLPVGPINHNSKLVALDEQTGQVYLATIQSIVEQLGSNFDGASHIYTVAEYDLSNYSTSNLLVLYPHNVAVLQFTNQTSISLPIDMSGQALYEIYLVSFNAANANTASTGNIMLYPNGTSYANEFSYVQNLNGSESSGDTSGFLVGRGYPLFHIIVGNFQNLRVMRSFGVSFGNSAFSSAYASLDLFNSWWGRDRLSRPWVYTGNIVFPQTTTGTIVIRKIVEV